MHCVSVPINRGEELPISGKENVLITELTNSHQD
jgi:hypothetical protein